MEHKQTIEKGTSEEIIPINNAKNKKYQKEKEQLITCQNKYLPQIYINDSTFFYHLGRILENDNLLLFLATLREKVPKNTVDKCNLIIINVYMMTRIEYQSFPVSICVSNIDRSKMKVPKGHNSQKFKTTDTEPYYLVRFCIITRSLPFCSPKITHMTSKCINLPPPRGLGVNVNIDQNLLLGGSKLLIITKEDTEIIDRNSLYPKLTDLTIPDDYSIDPTREKYIFDTYIKNKKKCLLCM